MLSTDHKPMDDVEQKRITENGGKIYQTQTLARVPGQTAGVQFPAVNPAGKNQQAPQQYLLGPYRVLPGRLSVSRTFGDIEAKHPK